MNTPAHKDRGPPERVLVATRYSGKAEEHHASLQELKRLVATAGGVVVGEVIQEREGIEPATFLGSGKVAETVQKIEAEKIQLVVFDHELSPTQNRNLEGQWKVKVLDRTGLILDIFAQHATSREGKLQVELAQLNYLLPRLLGQWLGLSRQAGGIGTSGPGETKLEVDRRRARDRIARLKKELRQVQMQRDLHRDKRQKVPVPIVSLVGYTNAGKSTLMNCLTDAGVLVEDKLFATLDPAVRRIRLPSGRHCLIADTVGFVHKLPHQLIEAFKATFREIDNASLLLHVIDTPEVRVAEQVETVDTVLQELGLSEKRTLRVFNKMDLMPQVPKWLQEKNSWIAISAAKEEGIEFLLDKIDAILASDLKRVTFFFPYRETRSLAELFAVGRVLKRQNVQEGIKVVAEVGDKFLGKYASYILDPAPST